MNRAHFIVSTAIALILVPAVALAEIHIVTVGDDFFSPNDLTIQAGDTVRWMNAAGGNPHDVTADDGISFASTIASSFTFDHVFTNDNAGENLYHCTVHSAPGLDRNSNMNGRITVEAGAAVFPINAGLNGNWWHGLDRSGEGVQIEISAGAGGSLVLVATFYSYDSMGNQIFMIMVGTVNGDTAEVDVFITDEGLWGDNFDPALVKETQWGTGTIRAFSCEAMEMDLRPNADYKALGYADLLMYDLIRLTTPAAPCPIE